MSRTPITALLAVLVCSLRAADESPILRPSTERSSDQPPPAAVAPADPAPARPRAISPATAQKLTAAVTAPPEAPTPDPVAEPIAPRQFDLPRNGIVRLPNFIVGEPRVRVPTVEREVLTPKGLLDLALSRHPGLRFGPLSSLNNHIAFEMLAEEERLNRMSRANELAALAAFSTEPLGEDARREIQRSFMRTNEWFAMGGSFQRPR